jgi:hypothetical protein
MHQQGQRNEGHGRQRQRVPDRDQRRAAGGELGQDVGGRLAQDVGVLEELLQQREADRKSEGDDHEEDARGASDGKGVHETMSFHAESVDGRGVRQGENRGRWTASAGRPCRSTSRSKELVR